MFCLTPGPEGILRDNGGWGEFGKGHEVAAVFVAAIVVMVVHGARFFESSKARLWIAALLILALSVVATPSAVLVIAGLCAFAPVAWLMRRSLTPVIYLGLFVAGTFLTGLLNYLTTGVASDLAVGSSMLDGKSAVPFNAAHADSLGWTTNLWLLASETKREAGIGNFLNNLTGQWVYIAQCWRLEYVGYALAISVVLLMGLTAVTRIYKPAQLTTPSVVDRREIRFGLAAMAAVAMGVTLLFCLLVSNDSDHISTYRGMSSLLCIPFLALCYLVTALDLRTRIPGLASGLLGSLRRIRTYIPVLVAFGLVFGCVGVWQSTNGVGALRDSLVHALGGTSTSAALQQQTGLPGRVPPGRGIEPTTRNLMGLVPADGVVATFNVHAYNGLDVSQLRYAGPTTTCWMQNMLAIESADPKAGAALLERYGPRYLLINPHLGIQPFDQTLLAAPVMSNEALRKYWRVVGSDNGTLLLRVVPAGDAGLDAGEVQQLSELRTATPTQVQETLSEYRRFREANGLDPAPQLIPCE